MLNIFHNNFMYCKCSTPTSLVVEWLYLWFQWMWWPFFITSGSRSTQLCSVIHPVIQRVLVGRSRQKAFCCMSLHLLLVLHTSATSHFLEEAALATIKCVPSLLFINVTLLDSLFCMLLQQWLKSAAGNVIFGEPTKLNINMFILLEYSKSKTGGKIITINNSNISCECIFY